MCLALWTSCWKRAWGVWTDNRITWWVWRDQHRACTRFRARGQEVSPCDAPPPPFTGFHYRITFQISPELLILISSVMNNFPGRKAFLEYGEIFLCLQIQINDQWQMRIKDIRKPSMERGHFHWNGFNTQSGGTFWSWPAGTMWQAWHQKDTLQALWHAGSMPLPHSAFRRSTEANFSGKSKALPDSPSVPFLGTVLVLSRRPFLFSGQWASGSTPPYKPGPSEAGHIHADQ